ncbi:MAG: TOBE domain-containing protein, partial [Chloroflexota bacterium]
TNGAQSQPVKVTVRPQHITINPGQSENMITFPAEIDLVEDLGGEWHIYLDVGGVELEALIPQYVMDNLTEGGAQVGIQPQHLQVYDPTTQRHLGQGAN